jgi:hypothetical protein
MSPLGPVPQVSQFLDYNSPHSLLLQHIGLVLFGVPTSSLGTSLGCPDCYLNVRTNAISSKQTLLKAWPQPHTHTHTNTHTHVMLNDVTLLQSIALCIVFRIYTFEVNLYLFLMSCSSNQYTGSRKENIVLCVLNLSVPSTPTANPVLN